MKIFYLDPSDSSSLCIFAKIYQTIHFRNVLNYIPIKFIWKYFLVCAGLGNLNWSLKVLSHLLPDIKVQPTLCCLHAGSGKQTDPSVWLYQCLPGIPGRVLMIQCHNKCGKSLKRTSKKKNRQIKPAWSKNFYMRTGLESSARRFTQWHCGEVTRPIMSPQGEGRGSLSQALRASVPLDSGPCTALWHCLHLALVIYSSSVILLSTCLCHFLNQIRNGLWLRLCFYTPLRVFCGWQGTYNQIPEP